MSSTHISFGNLGWVDTEDGARFKAAVRNEVLVRIAEYPDGYEDQDWYEDAHFGYVIEGELEVEFEHRVERFQPGDGIMIAGGPAERHRGRVIRGPVRLFLVDEASIS
jgi:hypothetical protein